MNTHLRKSGDISSKMRSYNLYENLEFQGLRFIADLILYDFISFNLMHFNAGHGPPHSKTSTHRHAHSFLLSSKII